MLSQSAAPGVRPSPIFFAIVAATAVAAWLTTVEVAPRLAVFGFIVGGWTISLIFHEFAHAFTAWRGGDHSVIHRGYLTLDPRTYTHPLLSFGLPLLFILMGGIGFPGGAVLINRGVLSERRASVVALAGPFTNLAMGLVAMAVLRSGLVDITSQPFLAGAVGFFGFLQITVFILNLLPVPGFDGYAAIEPLLPDATRNLMRPVSTYGPLIAILVIWRVEPAGDAFWWAVTTITEAFGFGQELWSCGYWQFRFWEDDVTANTVCRIAAAGPIG